MKTVAAFLIVIVAAGTGAPATCLGWEGRAADRRACCQRANHAHSEDQTAADDCCARHEDARLGMTAVSHTQARGLDQTPTVAGSARGLVAPAVVSISDTPVVRVLVHPPPGYFSPPLRI